MDIILAAIIQANKFGAQGIQVVGYRESDDPAQSPFLQLVTQYPFPAPTHKKVWFEE